VTRIVALGAGRMGRGIGHVFAYAGYRVDVIDFKARPREDGVKLRDAALAEIGANLGLLRDLGVLDEAQRQAILGRIRILPLEDAPAALAAGDVIFEGVTETLEAKRDAFARACAHARADAIIASTTSSMLADDLAARVTPRMIYRRMDGAAAMGERMDADFRPGGRSGSVFRSRSRAAFPARALLDGGTNY